MTATTAGPIADGEWEPRTQLVGREAELAALHRLLSSPETRLATIVGLAGVGKTRLAREMVRLAVAEGCPVAFVPLAAIRDADLVGDELVAALPGPPTLARTPAEAIWERFGGGRLLVVLDNLEQIPGSASVIRDLLDRHPALHVLATSARPVGLTGEALVRLRPLPLLPPTADVDVPLALANPAVALFVQRAVIGDATFALTQDNVAGVVATCRAVGGFPLAIELAAARSASIPPVVMAQQLAQPSGLGLLRDDTGADHHRHASIAATLQWANDMLAPAARRDLRHLAVFEGSFDLSAATTVLDPRPADGVESLDRLSPLIDVHLVDLSPADPDLPRFSLPVVVRSFARARLMEAGEADGARQRHRAHFQARCQSGLPLLAEEIGDVLAALDRAILDGGHDGGLHETVEATMALAPFPAAARALGSRLDMLIDSPMTHGDATEVARALALAAVHGVPSDGALTYAEWLAQRVDHAVAAARRSGDGAALREALQLKVRAMPMTMDVLGGVAAAREGLELSRAAGDERALARFELYCGMAALMSGDAPAAADLASSARGRSWGGQDRGTALQAALELHRLPPELTAGISPPLPSLEELLEQCEEAQEPLTGFFVLGALAVRDTEAGRLDAAVGWVHRALLVSQGWQRTRPLAPIGLVALLVSIAVQRGDLEQAVQLRTGIAAHDSALAAMPHVVAGYQAACDRLAAEVPAEQYAAWSRPAEGSTPDQAGRAALDYVHAVLAPARAGRSNPGPATKGPAPGPSGGGAPALTPREFEVLVQLGSGATNKEVAHSLGMSPKTVMHHSMAIYRKLGVRGRGEAAAWAHRHGMLGTPSPAGAQTPGRQADARR